MNTSNKSTFVKILCALIVGFMAGVGVFYGLFSGDNTQLSSSSVDEPLYWVAPMDPNYRRDAPGKSPMGMDLIPVYQEDAGMQEKGLVQIAPEVINNIAVRTGPAEMRTLHNEIVTVGYVQFDENKLIHIHPRVSGWVEKLYVNTSGDLVEKNKPLYTLYAPELVNAQEELVLALNRNNSRLIKAAENRLKALQISEEFITRLKKTKKIVQTITFYSPQDGVVDNLNIREGFYVQPGTTMLSIGALDELWIEAEIFERQASLVHVGDKASMTLDYLPGKEWRGQVEYIYPTLDKETRTVRVRLSFANVSNLLKPNMFAQITLYTESKDAVLSVPKEAIIRTGRQNRVVLALGEGRFKSIEVEVGRFDGTHAEIVSGLTSADSVVTSAQFLIDSESSKTSDFVRMDQHVAVGNEVKPELVPSSATMQSASAHGTVNSMDAKRGIVNISRGPIEKWNRPAATLDFEFGEQLDVSALKAGDSLDFSFEIRNQRFILTEFTIHEMENSHSLEHSAGEVK